MKTIKILIALAALALLFALPAKAQLVVRTNVAPQITLAWTPSPDPTVGGYNIYQGPATGKYTNVVFVAGVNASQVTLTNVVRGFNQFYAATAVSTNGLESVYSNEVNYAPPALPLPPVMKPPTGR